MRLQAPAVLFAAMIMALAPSVHAQGNNPLITVNEQGMLTLLFPGGAPISATCSTQNDPGPGGLTGALFCNLQGPPSLVFGDVFIRDTGGALSDLVRFEQINSAFGFVFYSALGGTAAADRGFPTAFFTNTSTVAEVDLGGGVNGAMYHPLANQPGFVAGFDATYRVESNEVTSTPEPASVLLLSTGLAGVFGVARRRRRAAAWPEA